MEKDSVQRGKNGQQLISTDTYDAYNVFGDPEVLPRVGDEYQVEVPLLITESEYILYTKKQSELEFSAGFPCEFLVGLPVPIMWINEEIQNMKHEGREFLIGSDGVSNKNGILQCETNKVPHEHDCLKDENSELKDEHLDIAWRNSIRSRDSTSLSFEHVMKSKIRQKYGGDGYCLVPDSFVGSWSDSEEASFLLGLYIFGKNLVQVKRFIENKTMGDILSFYYGKFYKSVEYRRWSDCRKMRSRRRVYGQKIFTGLRLQELLSRLFLCASEECQNTLLKVSKTYGEGKMSLEEYVSTLKAFVGIKSLVEAVGIGKGKQDLTAIALEHLKSNHVITMRPEIPMGKTYSSLTPEEIIKVLTGDIRLSKARSSNFFWEAIWPRLLAKGWHSEQPRNRGGHVAGSKRSLVFLMPGVEKFSRRSLVKGNHYFNSVADVLSKVALDPGLLELDVKADQSNGNKERYGWTPETKLEQDVLSNRQRPCYLQPRTPNRNKTRMKFTVVDTSLANGNGKTSKVREVRTLPVEVSKKTASGHHSQESDEDGSEVPSEDSESVDPVLFDQQDTKDSISKNTASTIVMFSYEKNLESGASSQRIPVDDQDTGNASVVQNFGDRNNFCDPVTGNALVKKFENHNNFCEGRQPRKSPKCRQRKKEVNPKSLAPVKKRHRRLSACTWSEINHNLLVSSVSPILEKDKHSCCSETTNSSENDPQKRVPTISSSKGSPIESSEGIFCGTNFGAESPYEKPQPETLIDLNLPQVSPDLETADVCLMELKNVQVDQECKQPENSTTARKPSAETACSEQQQPKGNSRRQSSRNRPLTARALEALADGFLTTSRRRKNKEVSPRENSTFRPSQRARLGMAVTESSAAGTEASQMGEAGNCVWNGNNSDMFSEFQSLSEGKMQLKFQDPEIVSWKALP